MLGCSVSVRVYCEFLVLALWLRIIAMVYELWLRGYRLWLRGYWLQVMPYGGYGYGYGYS